MSTTAEKLRTADEFEELGLDTSLYELVDGRIVKRPMPKKKHIKAQWRIRRVLDGVLRDIAIVDIELKFRLPDQYQEWTADVGAYRRERWDAFDDEDYPVGAPDLVVEVLSPSNKAEESDLRRARFLGNGCREYWVVNLTQETVEVATDGRIRTVYRSGESISCSAFPGHTVEVAAIFRD
jgi:Uma2 family endonuclease